MSETGGFGIGNSSITLVVPAIGSGGNNFAETKMAETTSRIACLPLQGAPGQSVTCAAVCTNNGPAVATNMGCTIVNAAALPGALLTGCQSSMSVPVGGAITCVVSFLLPTAGGVTVTAGSSAANDSNGGTSPTAGNNPSAASVVVVAMPYDVPISQIALILMAFAMMWCARNRQAQSVSTGIEALGTASGFSLVRIFVRTGLEIVVCSMPKRRHADQMKARRRQMRLPSERRATSRLNRLKIALPGK